MDYRNQQLKIENPCQKSWNTMTSHSSGKFCNHCAKTVIDFTQMSDQEIIRILSNSSGKTCGRFRTEQLNNPLRIIKSNKSKSLLYTFLTGLILAGASKKTQAKPLELTTIKNLNISTKINEVVFQQEEVETDSTKLMIKGIVNDEDEKTPLPGVSIKIKGQETRTFTNIDGEFKIPYSNEEKIILEVTYIGYNSKEISINRRDFDKNQKILIIPMQASLLGAVSIVTTKRWWEFWK